MLLLLLPLLLLRKANDEFNFLHLIRESMIFHQIKTERRRKGRARMLFMLLTDEKHRESIKGKKNADL